ncbi:hypothetical protein MMC30_001527 [Trapelia coarctata]|nr:hypothetical protein [Trapelia coarctata]
MPLPPHPLVIHGGCNCKAIRYKVEIPALPDRPIHPTASKEKDGEAVRLPLVCVCHCNDCRRATGSILPFFICSPIAVVSISCLPQTTPSDQLDAAKAGGDSHEARGPWVPASAVFKPSPEASDTFLAGYNSSEGRTRFFCGRCGTHLAYAAKPMPEGWPDMLDIVLGTFDRGDLETGWLEPERHLWWDYGVGWVKGFATQGAGGIDKHPSHDVSNLVE